MPELDPGNKKTADMDGLRYSPDDPYYRLGPVHTCLYVRVRETGDWDLFLYAYQMVANVEGTVSQVRSAFALRLYHSHFPQFQDSDHCPGRHQFFFGLRT